MIAGRNLEVNALTPPWTEDAVALPPGEKPIISKKAGDVWLGGIQELESLDGRTFEWGTSTGTIQPLKGGEPKTTNAKLFRVLRRQSDGSWKIARSVCNLDPAIELTSSKKGRNPHAPLQQRRLGT